MACFKAAHVVKDIILTCVRWFLAYPLSYRHAEELMQERRVSVDHSTTARGQCPSVGAWMSRTSGSVAHGGISIVRSISMATPLTFSFYASHKFLLDQLLVPNESEGGGL
jgi:hypothetical protein